jgi:hypothetical protein
MGTIASPLLVNWERAAAVRFAEQRLRPGKVCRPFRGPCLDFSGKKLDVTTATAKARRQDWEHTGRGACPITLLPLLMAFSF